MNVTISADRSNLLVVGAGELPAVLGRDHAATIVYAARDQRVAGVKIILCLDVDDNADLSSVSIPLMIVPLSSGSTGMADT